PNQALNITRRRPACPGDTRRNGSALGSADPPSGGNPKNLPGSYPRVGAISARARQNTHGVADSAAPGPDRDARHGGGHPFTVEKAMKRTRLGVVMDPISGIAPAKDSTLAMLLEARRRDYELWYFEQ